MISRTIWARVGKRVTERVPKSRSLYSFLWTASMVAIFSFCWIAELRANVEFSLARFDHSVVLDAMGMRGRQMVFLWRHGDAMGKITKMRLTMD